MYSTCASSKYTYFVKQHILVLLFLPLYYGCTFSSDFPLLNCYLDMLETVLSTMYNYIYPRIIWFFL